MQRPPATSIRPQACHIGMQRTAMALVVLLGIGFAGCADEAPATASDDPFSDQPVTVASGKGVIRGLVIDNTVTPVEGATIKVQNTPLEATTGSDGTFFFSDVEPGAYFMKINKPGWTSVQQSTTVVANVAKPEIVRVLLEQIPGSEPRAVTLKGEGFVQCGVGTPLTFHVCPLYDDQDKSTVAIPFDGTPDHIQVETTWESTQPAGEQLYLVYYFCDGSNCGARSDRWSEGVRDDIFVARTAGNNRTSLQAAVYASPGGPANGTGVALDQQFLVYGTFFYNIAEPDADWTFTADGEYPV